MTHFAEHHDLGVRRCDRFADVKMPGRATEPLLLVEEISHRVVNEYAGAIAAINFEATRIADADARAALRRSSDRLQAFAEAHRALQAPAAPGDMCLDDYLDRLCAALSEASLRERGVKLILVEDNVTLAAEQCWRVGLIVAGLITNSVQHGFDGSKGMIVVEVRQAGNEIVCTVADNGGCALNPTPSRGHRVVERLARELNGEIRWRFGPNGVTASLSFPAALHPVDALACRDRKVAAPPRT
jgi:two-component sensor histidine kinase